MILKALWVTQGFFAASQRIKIFILVTVTYIQFSEKLDKIKFISRWILVVGTIIAVIGIIHCSFAPVMYKQMMKEETLKDKAPGFAYFFTFCGFAVFYAGLLTIYSSFGLKKSEKWAWLIAISSALFVALGGISAVTFAKFGNLMIYAVSIGAISNILLLLLFYREFKNCS